MAYVAVGEHDKAKADFEHLLRVDPSAELDRSVAPKVRAVFEEAKAHAATSTRAPKPVYKKGWFWGVIGGVAAAGAIATGLALGLPRGNSAPVTVNPQ
jgi:hypothetical protein